MPSPGGRKRAGDGGSHAAHVRRPGPRHAARRGDRHGPPDRPGTRGVSGTTSGSRRSSGCRTTIRSGARATRSTGRGLPASMKCGWGRGARARRGRAANISNGSIAARASGRRRSCTPTCGRTICCSASRKSARRGGDPRLAAGDAEPGGDRPHAALGRQRAGLATQRAPSRSVHRLARDRCSSTAFKATSSTRRSTTSAWGHFTTCWCPCWRMDLRRHDVGPHRPPARRASSIGCTSRRRSWTQGNCCRADNGLPR